jgi:amino acid permease
MGERNAPVWVTVLLIIVGIACIAAGAVYLAEPARSLPSFFPGHAAGSAHHHTKHGIVAIGVAVVALAAAWMTTGARTATR